MILLFLIDFHHRATEATEVLADGHQVDTLPLPKNKQSFFS
jgi:hypothetical protein